MDYLLNDFRKPELGVQIEQRIQAPLSYADDLYNPIRYSGSGVTKASSKSLSKLPVYFGCFLGRRQFCDKETNPAGFGI